MRLLSILQPRKLLLVITLALSLLMHWSLLVGLRFDFDLLLPKQPPNPTPPIQVSLNYPPPIDTAVEPATPIASPADDSSNAIPPVESETPQPTLAEAENAIAEEKAAEPQAQTVNAQALKRQLLASIRQPENQASQTDNKLPGNWTQDALPQAGLPETQLLEPLSYTGAATTERWKSTDGTPESRTVLANGTVVCGRGHTLLPNSAFEANLMLMRVCGKEKGGRENQNRLARFHRTNNNESTPPAKQDQ